MVRVGHRLYVGGMFDYVGPNTGDAVPLSLRDGSRQRPFPRVLGPVDAVTPDGAGGYYVGGLFDVVGGFVRHNLAHVLGDGRVDPAFDPDVDGEVKVLALDGGMLYAAGRFTKIDGAFRAGLAQLDARTGTPTAWNPLEFAGDVLAIAVRGDTVYVGGSFSQIGGARRSGLAALDAVTGRATSWDPRVAGFGVSALRLSGSALYVGGTFRWAGGQRRRNLAALSVVTGDATAWDPHAIGPVNTLTLAGNDVYVGGHFRKVGGRRRTYLAALDVATGRATAWNPRVGRGFFERGVHALAVSRSRVYIGGSFRKVGGRPRSDLAAVDRATGAILAWNPGPSSGDFTGVTALALSRHSLLAAGHFWSVGGARRSDLAALDARTGALARWNPDAHGRADIDWVQALASDGRALYAGGSFSRIAGQRRINLAALDLRTGAATAWNPGADRESEIGAVAIHGPALYIGGDFHRIGGAPRHALAAVGLRTGAVTRWHPRVAGEFPSVDALAISGRELYVGGDFAGLDGVRRRNAGAFDLGRGELDAWNPHPDSSVYVLAASPTAVFAGGDFDRIGGRRRHKIAKLEPRTGVAAKWRTRLRYHVCSEAETGNPACDNSPFVDSLAISGRRLYVGGFFTSIGGRQRPYLAALDTRTAAVRGWRPGADGRALALTVAGSAVYAGGEFRTMGRLPRGSVAIFPAAGG